MTRVLEYIIQNYTLFLFGAIIILLAVIGYYAEKTNFGQRKADKIKDKKTGIAEITLKNTDLHDITSETENGSENIAQSESNVTQNINSNENIINDKTINVETNSIENNENVIESVKENEETVNPIIDAIHKELNLVSNDVIFNVEEIRKKETKNKKKEEAFNKFSDEFDALLPKREIISDDLLGEIDDLELGKTQKFNLKDFKRFDNIKLPRISDTVAEEQDIWKY